MKRFFILSSCMGLLLILFNLGSVAQCISNPDFSSACGTPLSLTTSGNCPPSGFPFSTFTQTCIPNWGRTHGAPTYGSGIALRAHDLSGTMSSEGIWGGYSFVPHTQYCLNVNYSLQNLIGSSVFHPRFVIAAANFDDANLPTSASCPEPLPGYISDFEVITTITTMGTSQQQYLTFEVSKEYDYIWVYTLVDDEQDDDNGLWLTLTYLNVCQDMCNSSIIYNNGTLPTGLLQYGSIQAGTTAGSGGGSSPVDNSASHVTRLRGADHVQLLPGFNATASGSGYLQAYIAPCDSNVGCDNLTRPPIPLLPSYEINEHSKLYPSPASDFISITNPLKETGTRTISIYNTKGILVRRQRTNLSLSTISVQNLPAGIYYVRILNSKGAGETLRFIKQ